MFIRPRGKRLKSNRETDVSEELKTEQAISTGGFSTKADEQANVEETES